MENENIDIAPSPARLVESLRDTGYSLVTSIADIVDNSIAANATKIQLNLEMEIDGNLKLYIADNGDGMSEVEIINALKYGSKKRESPKSLGKFGMGLKTASTSFCRSLTVISKKNAITSTRQLDLDQIVKEDKWFLLKPQIDENDLYYLNNVAEQSGTLIIWDKIDRMVRSHDNHPARKQIEHYISNLKEHLSGVFYRFISNKDNPVVIMINNELLEGWDPFCSWMNQSLLVSEQKVPVEVNGKTLGSFDFKAYILPNKSAMSMEETRRARYSLDNQGFHVYREDRLIYSGGWLNRMFVKEPHFNMIRVEISFDHSLDEIFQIDIKKSNIILPHSIRNQVKEKLIAIRREGERRYRGARKKNDSATSEDIHGQSSNAISKKMDDNVSSEVKDFDSSTGTATVKNPFGEMKIKIQRNENSDLVVLAEESLEDGLLWSYFIGKDNKHGVLLNQSHEFYRRFYYPNQENIMLVQAMDSVFWALAEAELTTINQNAKKNLEELRFRVSRILKDLAEELPELTEDQDMGSND